MHVAHAAGVLRRVLPHSSNLTRALCLTLKHMPDAVTETNNNDPIRVKVVSNTGKEVVFQVKPSTKLGVLMREYCKRLKLNIDATRFLFDGNRLNEGLLVSQSGLEMDDIIDVQEQMEGG